MAWAKLDDGFWSDPDIDRLGNEAAGVFARMLSYCGQHLTDGHVPETAARYISAKRRPLDLLVQVGFIQRNGDGYDIPKFLEFNPSREEVEGKRNVRAQAGRQGGIASGKARSK